MTTRAALDRFLTAWWRGGSGPRSARLFHRLLALCTLVAWLSLGSQIQLLIGSRGLLPLARLVESIEARGESVWTRFPTLLLLDASDATLDAGIALGVLLALLALLGLWPRLCAGVSAPLYLSYAVAGRGFTSFQWDNLLVECLVLAALLPRDRAAPMRHWLMRALLFKLYLESGVAKAQSALGDWFDGSAMTFYYETAPLPAWPAWYAHHLPAGWHHLESFGALGLETLGALLILGPRPARLTALVAFTGFQLLNAATANYGFFIYLTLCLHVFLLDDRDLERAARRLRGLRAARAAAGALAALASWLPVRAGSSADAVARGSSLRRAGSRLATAIGLAWLAASLAAGLVQFSGSPPLRAALGPLVDPVRPLRVANVYHLFGHITRDRFEPEFQTLAEAGAPQAGRRTSAWRAHPLHYKPGAIDEAPPLVAPHQPRVDFLLWFHGLAYQRGAPDYVVAILRGLCWDPESVAPLFRGEIPEQPRAVRVDYWRYNFTTPAERRETGDWWTREKVSSTRRIPCSELRGSRGR